MLKDVLKDRICEYLRKMDISNIKLNNDFEVEFLAQGEYNINFVIDDKENKYVFRINTGSQLEIDNQIKYEFEALKVLEISGVTPKVYYVDDSKEFFDYGILIMEFLEGRPLEYDKDLDKAAKIFAKIHSLDLERIDTSNFIMEENLFTDRIKEAKRLLKDFLVSPMINSELKKFFNRFLEWAEENKYREKYFIEDKWHVINNTEVNSHNFIIGRNHSYLIDWEKPVISDPSQDLTQFLADTTTLWKANYILSNEEKDFFYKNYTEGLNGKDKNIRERVHLYSPYLYLRALSWCAYAYLEYKKPGKAIKNMDTYNKIKQYLDIDFMNKLLKEYL
jgi:predicted Ser/Thr protein kinase